jgi:hypothetical protein
MNAVVLKSALCMIILSTVAFAEQKDTALIVSPGDNSTVKMQFVPVTDSSNHATTIQHQISSDTLSSSDSSTDNGAAVSKKDTLSKISDSDTIDAFSFIKSVEAVKGAFTNRLSKSRAQGYGGGVILEPLILGFKMKPINNLIRHDATLKKFSFPNLDDGYKPILAMGAIPFGGLGNGIRIGVGGWGGKLSLSSEPNANDSIINLSIHLSYGGFMVEKALVRNNVNIIVGGMLGYGTIELKQSMSGASVWETITGSNTLKTEAPYLGLEMHSGLTVSIMPWLHLGGDLNGMLMLSVNGFNGPGAGSFMSVSPGLRIRIVLGNLG